MALARGSAEPARSDLPALDDEAGADLFALLDAVSALLTTGKLSQLNGQMVGDTVDVTFVARRWLAEQTWHEPRP